MNMAIAKRIGGSVSYFIGIDIGTLKDYFQPLIGSEYESVRDVSIRDAKTLGPGPEKIETAKEEIRAGRARILELGPPQIIIFE